MPEYLGKALSSLGLDNGFPWPLGYSPVFILCGLTLLATGSGFATGCIDSDPWVRGASESRRTTLPPTVGVVGPAAVQELRIAGSPPTTLDPARVRDSGSSQYTVELFAGLVKLDPNLEVIGDLAASWEVRGNGEIYTFVLRDSKFADGKVIEAQDVQYSLARALSSGVESGTALTHLGNIFGAHAYFQGLTPSLPGVQIVDSHTIEIRLTHPLAFFLYKLTHPVSLVVDSREVDAPNWYRHPNSSGPFKLLAWDDGKEIVLEKNGNYHSPPILSKVYIALISSSEALLRYETNTLDVVEIHHGNVERFRDSNDPLKAHYVHVPQFALFYMGFNTAIPPFDDVHVRRAFAKALDIEKIIRVSLRGHEALATGILPFGFPGYDPSLGGFDYAPGDARAELLKSTYGSPKALPEITMLIPSRGLLLPAHIEASLFLIQENLGIDVAVLALEWPDFLDQIYGDMDEFQLYWLGWSADYPDPHNFLDLMFHSDSLDNVSRYSNLNVDALLERARTEPNDARRFSIYSQVESIVSDEVPIIPFWHGLSHFLVRPTVKGLRVPPSTQEWMSTVWIAEKP